MFAKRITVVAVGVTLACLAAGWGVASSRLPIPGLAIQVINPPEGEGGEPSFAECDEPFQVRAVVVDDEPGVAGEVVVGAVLSLPGTRRTCITPRASTTP